ncbi:MAG TPA: electron transfer flavoprotein subunit alpha/FixB family protein [Acidimicrobiales bacterium]|nr:electron transfer flavoprotein subunit alpha/FixB family protein [Acidimicrobiales bacterium]
MKALVFLEQRGEEVTRGSLAVLTKAAALQGATDGDGGIGAVLAGRRPLAALAELAGRYGAGTVHVAEHDSLDPALARARVGIVADLVRAHGYDTVMFSTSVLASDVAAGLAARLGAGLNWDLVDLTEEAGALVGRRTALQESVLVEVGWRSPVRLALFRPGVFEAQEIGGTPTVEAVAVAPAEEGVHVVRQQVREEEGRSIEDADVIVAGGIGLGGAEQFAMAEELASLLGGAVAATRAVVYKGWYPRAAQVGQTGKTVAPNLYVALGVSGAVQHKVGMQNSKVIISINKNPTAPIFEVSDLAVVGDVHVVVPQLIELLRARKG